MASVESPDPITTCHNLPTDWLSGSVRHGYLPLVVVGSWWFLLLTSRLCSLKRISGSQSLENSVLLFLHLIIICIFFFFISFSLFFHLKNDHHFFHSGLFVWMLMVLLFGWWLSSCFVLSPVFFLLLFTYLGGEGRGGEGRGVEEEGRGEGTQLGSLQATWLDPGPCKNFPKIGKLQCSSSFFHFFSHLGVTCRTCKPSSIHCCIGRADSHQINLKCTGTRLQKQGHTGEIPMHMPEAGHIEAQMIRTYCSEMSISSTRKRLGSQRIKILLKYFWTRAICTVVKEVLSGTMPQMYKQGGNCKYWKGSRVPSHCWASAILAGVLKSQSHKICMVDSSEALHTGQSAQLTLVACFKRVPLHMALASNRLYRAPCVPSFPKSKLPLRMLCTGLRLSNRSTPNAVPCKQWRSGAHSAHQICRSMSLNWCLALSPSGPSKGRQNNFTWTTRLNTIRWDPIPTLSLDLSHEKFGKTDVTLPWLMSKFPQRSGYGRQLNLHMSHAYDSLV